MIINVKSFMAAVMAVILILAVVVPITSAMVGVSGEKVQSDNELSSDEYLMTRSTAAAAPRISANDLTYGTDSMLYVGEQEMDITNRTVIFGADFILEFYTDNTGFFRFTSDDDGTKFIFTSHDEEYMTFDNGTWTIYNTVQGGGGAKTDGVKDYSARDFEDPDAKAALMERVPAANKELFTEAQLEQMVKEGVDILRALEVYKTGTYSWIVYPDDEGELYNASSTSSQVYVDSGATIYCAGIHMSTEGVAVLQGTLAHMQVLYNYTEVDEATIQAHYTRTAYSNLLDDVTYSGGDSEYDIHSFIVPLKYTSGVDSGLTGTLVSLVPVVLIVGLIIGLVTAWVLRRGGEEF